LGESEGYLQLVPGEREVRLSFRAFNENCLGHLRRAHRGLSRLHALGDHFLSLSQHPRRYATGYLGDIGVPPSPDPMDFSAFFEVYLDNKWWPMDARHNIPRLGRVLMARGRDATDVALTTSFGPSKLVKFWVVTEEVAE